jgi:iron-sulfur cluster assembly protein
MIHVTDAAKKKILANLKQRGHGIGIQVGIRTTGCSGLAYTFEYADRCNIEHAITDYVYEGFCIQVKNEHVPIVDGMTIDYVRQGLNEGFEFTNGNEKDRCGCGESFRI